MQREKALFGFGMTHPVKMLDSGDIGGPLARGPAWNSGERQRRHQPYRSTLIEMYRRVSCNTFPRTKYSAWDDLQPEHFEVVLSCPFLVLFLFLYLTRLL
jgi:hypothetical protein